VNYLCLVSLSFVNNKSFSILSEIRSDIFTVEKNPAILRETNFDERTNAIDFLDFYVIDRIEGLLREIGLDEKPGMLKQRALKLKRKLEKIDARLFKQLHEKIKSGICRQASFREMVHAHMGTYFTDNSRRDMIGYDNLDVFINRLLSDKGMPEPILKRKPEMVFYQKTPARIIFALAELAELRQHDVFFDIGSGLGQAAILVNLLSGVAVKGIEYEPAYCSYSIECATPLNLTNVEFINADAPYEDYSGGTVFFMYTPFEGSMLLDMLEILRKESQKRTIRLLTYGPCSPCVAQQNWLRCLNGDGHDPYSLYHLRS